MLYRYNALDIAAYFKWSALPQEAEVAYLDFLFQLRGDILARPLTKDIDSFKHAVYREMYHVWSRGFENEFSDVNRIAGENAVSIFCDQKFLALESYMKLLAMHLIVSSNLPFIQVQLSGFYLLIGIESKWEEYQDNLLKAIEALELSVSGTDGNPVDFSQQLPNHSILISLKETYLEKLFDKNKSRMKRVNNYQEKMKILREKSIEEKKKRDEEEKKKKISKKSRIRLQITSDEPVPPPGITRIKRRTKTGETE